MSEARSEKNAREGRAPVWLKRVGVYAAVLVGAFLLGLVPMWLTARERANERDLAQRNLRLSQMQLRLASATIEARRGEYEPARSEASEFFTELRAETDRTQDRALTTEQTARAREMLAARDDVITLLARNDPASADRLAGIYVAYRDALGAKQATHTAAPQH